MISFHWKAHHQSLFQGWKRDFHLAYKLFFFCFPKERHQPSLKISSVSAKWHWFSLDFHLVVPLETLYQGNHGLRIYGRSIHNFCPFQFFLQKEWFICETALDKCHHFRFLLVCCLLGWSMSIIFLFWKRIRILSFPLTLLKDILSQLLSLFIDRRISSIHDHLFHLKPK